VLAEDKNERASYIVIDGKQRLLSLRQFAARKNDADYTPLGLEGLELRTDLNGHTLEELEGDSNFEDDVRAFQNQPVRTVVIKGWPDENVLYLIFLRLNTGSVQLSPQELRQALHPGPFVKYVDRTSGEMQGLQDIFKTSEPDFRMRDAELLVRYFAFRNFLTEYRGNLKGFLDYTCKALNASWGKREDELKAQADDLQSAIDATFKIFGRENSFRKWDGDRYEGRFNRAIFDVMVFYFLNKRVRKHAIEARKKVQLDFKRLCTSNRDFSRFIETSTKSLEATGGRLNIWGSTLKRRLRITIQVPELRHNRIHF
jgi:hypothetical protein